MSEIRNVKIESTMLGWEDHGMLTAWLTVTWPGGGQGFGGYALDEPIQIGGKFSHRQGSDFGMRFVESIIKTVGVESWEKLKGSYCRIDAEHSKIHRLGHLLEDRWFDPQTLLPKKDAA